MVDDRHGSLGAKTAYDSLVSRERRRARRLASSARILWTLEGDDFLQLDRVRDVSDSGAFVLSDAISAPGAVLEFELHDEGGKKIAGGTARVVRVDPMLGMGIAFLDVTIDADRVSASMPSIAPPRLRAASERGFDAVSTEIITQIAPLSLQGLDPIIIGIDLGTTNTCASWVDGEQPRIIPGRMGSNTIPSMINFERDGRVHIGQRAADRQVLYPEATVYGSKRLLGRTYTEELARTLQAHFAYPLAEAEGQRFGVDLGDQVVSMDAIAARVLGEVRSTAEDFLGCEVHSAVITVPAYFSEVQREAVRRAAAAADLTVHRIVNEPTAAAVAYGWSRGEEARIAVWDFGGGTFDFSVVDIAREQYEVVATGGDNFVGGEDFDDALASLLLEEFLAIEGLAELEPTPQQIVRLRDAAEIAKRALSVQTEYDVRLPGFTKERDLFVTVTRAAFELRTKPLIDRAIAIARGVLLAAEMLPTDVDDVVLVGGTTRIPAVQRAVAELFERRPSKRINPDEAVALGAALLAHEIRSEDGPVLLDLLPMTVGHAADGRRFVPLVKRSARLPFEEVLEARADRTGLVQVPLFQGEATDVSKNEYLGTVVVRDERLRDEGKVRLLLSFDEACVMAVDAVLGGTNEPVEVELERERPLAEVLRALGAYTGPRTEEPWQLPQTRISRVLGKLFGIFKSSRQWG